MIKRIIFIFLVAIISYYAGSQNINIKDIFEFFDGSNINLIFTKTFDKTLEFLNEKK